MKAAVHSRFGPPEVLEIRDVEKPVPRDDEALIAVRVASLNPLDGYFMRGEPFFFRMMSELSKSGLGRPGVDLAGQVEAVGGSVTRWRPGDQVFGVGTGTLAEYVCARQDKLVRKPAHITFEQAAGVPVAALTALQGLRDQGRIRSVMKVLIHGASGGVGTFAVQIAKSFGAEVTGVCSTRNLDMVRSIGADHVVDYTQEDFTRSARRYDLILDCFADRALPARRRLLKPGGTYVLVGFGGPGGRWIGPLARVIKGVVLSTFAKNVVMFVSSENQDDLDVLRDLMETKKVSPVFDTCYPLSEAPEAMRHLQTGHARGKVVVTMGGDSGR